ncbi:hypothetical protein MtrunA17_Chr1g0205511 [Medicago truncatula]|uniref:Uncharacterized protein n=1 Tax=Medicago truncatula TaxID=3880 RepID=A0A396JWU6_MEDTR|nr:hypothetical protein MtrunA17_Chr1g0205511 [Medicago truncatula]
MGWKKIGSETEGRKKLFDMTNAETAAQADFNVSSISPGSLLFAREVRGVQLDHDNGDHKSLQKGYVIITVAPLAAISQVEVDC